MLSRRRVLLRTSSGQHPSEVAATFSMFYACSEDLMEVKPVLPNDLSSGQYPRTPQSACISSTYSNR
jgi:hypothetical protein